MFAQAVFHSQQHHEPAELERCVRRRRNFQFSHYARSGFEQQYFNSAEVVLAPNPAKDMTSLYVGGNDSQVRVTVYSLLGGVLYKTKVRLKQNRKVMLPTYSLPVGSYYVKIEGNTTFKNLQLIKE